MQSVELALILWWHCKWKIIIPHLLKAVSLIPFHHCSSAPLQRLPAHATCYNDTFCMVNYVQLSWHLCQSVGPVALLSHGRPSSDSVYRHYVVRPLTYILTLTHFRFSRLQSAMFVPSHIHAVALVSWLPNLVREECVHAIAAVKLLQCVRFSFGKWRDFPFNADSLQIAKFSKLNQISNCRSQIKSFAFKSNSS